MDRVARGLALPSIKPVHLIDRLLRCAQPDPAARERAVLKAISDISVMKGELMFDCNAGANEAD